MGVVHQPYLSSPLRLTGKASLQPSKPTKKVNRLWATRLVTLRSAVSWTKSTGNTWDRLLTLVRAIWVSLTSWSRADNAWICLTWAGVELWKLRVLWVKITTVVVEFRSSSQWSTTCRMGLRWWNCRATLDSHDTQILGKMPLHRGI